MKISNNDLRVHLDHLIHRQNIRYVPNIGRDQNSDGSNEWMFAGHPGLEDRALRYEDIKRDEWFNQIRKPDFQRETNAWTPEDCVEYLDSVITGRIIPSIILWRNQENNFIYVLDGAHRLSVIRAWMTDDWGDKAGEYYSRRDEELIIEAADRTRNLVRNRIGIFKDFQVAWQEHTIIANQGKAPKMEMGQKRFAQADFYIKVVGGLLTLSIQWERGNYDSAEQSFLRINRRGQVLDPWEANLIEYRRGSYARSIMCIANGGESGHYWPEPSELDGVEENLTTKVRLFGDMSSKIHKLLFVPPYQSPITNLNVPLLVAPAYFQKHRYLLEVIPLIVDQEIATSPDDQIAIMSKDTNSPARSIIENADRILTTVENKVTHIVSQTHNSKSLSIVPLFYWYNQKAQYARGLLYGFLYWLLSGTDDEIFSRKMVFTCNRDRFEHFLFYLKPEIATLQESGGAGLYATKKVAAFFHDLLTLLLDNPLLPKESDELKSSVLDILRAKARMTNRQSKVKTSRSFSHQDKSQINVRELFENAIRCHICSGVINIQYGGTQYDHIDDYSTCGVTDPDTGKPTHPFCNNNKHRILAIKAGELSVLLPHFHINAESKKPVAKSRSKVSGQQMVFPDFWGHDDFPQ